LKERRELEELEQELAKLTTENTPSPQMKKKQVSQELKRMQEQLDEEEELKQMEEQLDEEEELKQMEEQLDEGEMRMSPRKSPTKQKKKGLLSKLSKIFSKKKKETSYY
jgi:hypothetical protein